MAPTPSVSITPDDLDLAAVTASLKLQNDLLEAENESVQAMIDSVRDIDLFKKELDQEDQLSAVRKTLS